MKAEEEYKYEDPFKEKSQKNNDIFSGQKVYAKVHCPSCGSDVHSDNLNINDKIGKCSNCHAVFPLGQFIHNLNLKEASTGHTINKPIEVDIIELENSTELMTKEYTGPLTYLTLTMIVLFSIIGIVASFKNGFNSKIFSVSVLPIVLYLYYMYRQAQHYVHIVMDKEFISYFKDPKGVSKDKSYKIEDIKKVTSVYDQIWGGFKISMIMDDGQGEREVKLMRSSKKVSDYIAQEVRKFIDKLG